MSEAAITIEAVSKSFGRTHAVRDLDLVVPTGSVCGFLGPNGAGKSTTIRMIMSIIYPDSGSIDVLGSNALMSKDRIGYLPEERGVYKKMRVGEFVEYIGKLKGLRGPDLRKRVRDWLERVELPDVEKKRCQELSKGMQQKIQFLAAVIHDPDLIILDEPFSGLDPVNAVLLNRLIRELHDQGRTIIFSTHTLHQAELICDRIFLIHHGVKLLDATLDEIREIYNPKTIVAEPLAEVPDWHSLKHIVHATPNGAGGRIELTIDDEADPTEVMRSIMQLAPMRSVALRQPTLEEIFVDLVLNNRGEAEAERAREELLHA